jgi:hypothetical protein
MLSLKTRYRRAAYDPSARLLVSTLPRREALVKRSRLSRTFDALLTDHQESRAELSASVLQAFLRA